MHHLANLNFTIQSQVYQMPQDKFPDWQRIVDTMRLCADQYGVEAEGANLITDENAAWKLKMPAVNIIMETMC